VVVGVRLGGGWGFVRRLYVDDGIFLEERAEGQLCGEGGLSDTHTTCSIIVIISVISTVHITSVG